MTFLNDNAAKISAAGLALVVGLAASSASIGCGVDASVDEPAPEESSERGVDGSALELSERVYLVGEVGEFLTPDGARVVVDRDAPAALNERREGDILVVGEFFEGRWRLIESVDRDADGRLVLQTRQALLTEVVRSGSFDIVMQPEDGSYAARVEGISAIDTPNRTRRQALVDPDASVNGVGSLSVDADISEWDRAQIDRNDLALSVEGGLKTEPTLKIGFELADYEIVETTVWAAGDMELDVDLSMQMHPDGPGGAIGPSERNRLVELCPSGQTDCEFSVEMLGSRFVVRPEARIQYRYLGDGTGELSTGYRSGASNYLKAGFRHSEGGFEVIRDFEGFDVVSREVSSKDADNDFTLNFEMQLDISYLASVEPVSSGPWWQAADEDGTVVQALTQASGSGVLPELYFEVTPYSGYYNLEGSVKPPACGLTQSLTLRGHATRNNQTHPLYERALIERTDNLIQTDQRVYETSGVTPNCDATSWCITYRDDPPVCRSWYPNVDATNYVSLAIIDCGVEQCSGYTPGSPAGEACRSCQSRLCDAVEVSGAPGCELQPEFCDSDNDCESWEMCAFNKQCIRDTPLRVTVSWAAPVDLELYAFDQNGSELHELTGSAYDSAPDGWMAARSTGDDPIGAPYFEAAVYAFADPNEPLRFFVENRTELDEDSEIAYTLRIDHLSGAGFDGFTRQYEGRIADLADETSIGYVYHSPVEIEHCYKIDPANDTLNVCASGAAAAGPAGLGIAN